MSQRDSGRVMGIVRAARWKIESALTALFALAALVTAVFPRWIEALGFEPDGGNGSAEWTIVLALAVGALASAALSRRHYVRRFGELPPGEGSRS